MKHGLLIVVMAAASASSVLAAERSGMKFKASAFSASCGKCRATLEAAAQQTAGGRFGEYEASETVASSVFEEIGVEVYTRKYLHLKGDRHFTVAVDREGNALDLGELNRKERQTHEEKYGKLSKGLFEFSKKDSEQDTLPVVLWLDETYYGIDADAAYLKMSSEHPDILLQMKEANKNRHAQMKNSLGKLRSKLNGDATAKKVPKFRYLASQDSSDGSPFLFAMASAKTLKAMMKESGFVSIDAVGGVKPEEDLKEAQIRFGNYGNEPVEQGVGIRTAIWHAGYPSDVGQLGYPTYRYIQSYFPTVDQNNTHLAYMIAGVRNSRTLPDKGVGMSTGTQVYVANYAYGPGMETWIPNALSSYSWVRGYGASVVNHSWHLAPQDPNHQYNGFTTNEQTNGGPSYIDRALDYYAYFYPYTLAVQASGNIDVPGEFVNHKGTNTLVVGQAATPTAMDPASAWANGYGPELPHVVSIVDNSVSMFERVQNGQTQSVVAATGGTSLAASLMAGYAANVQGLGTGLATWPEATRAVIMASSASIEGGYWTEQSYSDGKDGAGLPYMQESRGIVSRHLPSLPVLPAAADRWGYHKGYFPSGSLTEKNFYIDVYGRAGSAYDFNLVLSWNAYVGGGNYSNHILTDLDLQLFDENNNLVASSVSGGNSTEMITIPNLSSTTKRYRVRFFTYSTPQYPTYFGIAWAVRNQSADVTSSIPCGCE